MIFGAILNLRIINHPPLNTRPAESKYLPIPKDIPIKDTHPSVNPLLIGENNESNVNKPSKTRRIPMISNFRSYESLMLKIFGIVLDRLAGFLRELLLPVEDFGDGLRLGDLRVADVFRVKRFAVEDFFLAI